MCHGRARQSSGTGPCGDCKRILWVPGPRDQYSGKIRFIGKPALWMYGTHCHWRSNTGPRLLATVIRGQIVNPCALHCTCSPISLEVRLWTILTSHSHYMSDSGPRWLPIVTSGHILDHGGSPLSLDLRYWTMEAFNCH